MIVYNVNEGIDQALSKHCNFMNKDQGVSGLEEKVVDALQFRDRIRSVIGEAYTDDEAIERIYHLLSYLVPKLKEFRDTICGYLNIDPEDTRDDTQKAIDRIYSLIRFKQCHDLEVKESSQFRQDVKQLLIDWTGRDITDDEAIAEIKRLQLQSLEADSPRPIDQIEIAKLKRELSIANKVIARLVGE